METFQVAHIKHDGQDVILVLVTNSFASNTTAKKNEIYAAMQSAATSAGLAGGVVLVWDQSGRPVSWGPTAWQSYLSSITWDYILSNVNRSLTISA